MVQLHKDVLALGGYTAVVVTVVVVLGAWNHRRISKITVEFNGKRKKP